MAADPETYTGGGLTELERANLKAAIDYLNHCMRVFSAFRDISAILKEVELADSRLKESQARLKATLDAISQQEGVQKAIIEHVEASRLRMEQEKRKFDEFMEEVNRKRSTAMQDLEKEISDLKAKRMQELELWLEDRRKDMQTQYNRVMMELDEKLNAKRAELAKVEAEYAERKARLEDFLDKIKGV